VVSPQFPTCPVCFLYIAKITALIKAIKAISVALYAYFNAVGLCKIGGSYFVGVWWNNGYCTAFQY